MTRNSYVTARAKDIRASKHLDEQELEAFEREFVEAQAKGIEKMEKLVVKYATRIRERALQASGRGRHDKLSKRRK